MKKIVSIALLLLVVAGPGRAMATPSEPPCADGAHDVMTPAMEDCHNAPCCVMTVPMRDSAPGTQQTKRSYSTSVDEPAVQPPAQVTRPLHDRRGNGPPTPATTQTTPVLRR